MSLIADILIIDDELVVKDAVKKICALDNYSVETAANVKSAIDKISKTFFPIIVCDIMMPDGDGFQILDELHNRNIESSVIMTTGYSTVENAVTSLYKGAIDFIPKPFTVDELLSSVYRANKYQQIKNRQKFLQLQNKNEELLFVNCPVKYHRLGYASWMFKERDGSVLIGVCDLFLKTIETVKEIEVLQSDEELMQGISCVSFISTDGRTHKLLSPISGRIVEVNQNIKMNASLIEKDPYFEGWIYRIIPSDIDYEQKHLIMGSSELL